MTSTSSKANTRQLTCLGSLLQVTTLAGVCTQTLYVVPSSIFHMRCLGLSSFSIYSHLSKFIALLTLHQVAGWEPGVLAGLMEIVNPATNQTKCFVGDSDAKACFPADEFWTDDQMNDCKLDSVVDENVDGPFSALPGCNTIQSGVATATLQTGCGNGPSTFKAGGGAMTAVPNSGAASSSVVTGTASAPIAVKSGGTASSGSMPAPQQIATGSPPASQAQAQNTNPDSPGQSSSSCTAPSSSLPAGWSLYTHSSASGCYVDAMAPSRALNGITLADAGVMFPGQKWSSTRCVQYCDAKGYHMAGTESGGQCFCGNELSGGQEAAAETAGKTCDKCCEGDGGEVCGGAGTLTVFAKEGGAGAKIRSRPRGRYEGRG